MEEPQPENEPLFSDVGGKPKHAPHRPLPVSNRLPDPAANSGLKPGQLDVVPLLPGPVRETGDSKAGAPRAGEAKGAFLALEDCIEIAVQNNLSLQISRLNDRAADVNVRSAWAQYFPEFNAGLTHSNSRTMGERAGDGTTTISGGVTQRLPYGTSIDINVRESRSRFDTDTARGGVDVSVRQPLWKGRGTDVGLAGIRTARINRLISRDNLDLDVQGLIFDVRSAYADVIRQIQNREVDESSVRSSKTFLDLTTAREAAGQVTKLDVFNAEVQLRSRELQLLTTERSLEEAYDRLKQIMDLDLAEPIRVDAPFIDFGEQKEENVVKEIVTDEVAGAVMLKVTRKGTVDPEPAILFQASHFDEPTILKEALDNRLDLLNSRRALAIEKIQTLLNKDGLGQQVDLVGSFGRSFNGRSLVESGNGDEANDWSVGVQYSIPWGKIRDRASYELALLDLQRAEIALKQSRTGVQLDVRSIMRRLRELERSLLIEGKRVEQAKRSVEAAQISFDRGLKDSFDVIRAEDDLKNAKNQFIRRRQDYAVLLAQLELVVGKPTGRVDLTGQSVGGMIDSRLPDSLRERGLPPRAPDAAPHPADDPFNDQREYRKDFSPKNERTFKTR